MGALNLQTPVGCAGRRGCESAARGRIQLESSVWEGDVRQISQGEVQGLSQGRHRSDAGAGEEVPAKGPEKERPARRSHEHSSLAFQRFCYVPGARTVDGSRLLSWRPVQLKLEEIFWPGQGGRTRGMVTQLSLALFEVDRG